MIPGEGSAARPAGRLSTRRNRLAAASPRGKSTLAEEDVVQNLANRIGCPSCGFFSLLTRYSSMQFGQSSSWAVHLLFSHVVDVFDFTPVVHLALRVLS
ncbi:hypothetical protein RB195_012556 [Necator americanus]|uniref:Uncharacterized protein n=1 Tax=Necator americanus TaxID=51031 RepID=A0ABR1DRG2_NECAM